MLKRNLEISKKNQENKEAHKWKAKESRGAKSLGILKPETVKIWKKHQLYFRTKQPKTCRIEVFVLSLMLVDVLYRITKWLLFYGTENGKRKYSSTIHYRTLVNHDVDTLQYFFYYFVTLLNFCPHFKCKHNLLTCNKASHHLTWLNNAYR